MPIRMTGMASGIDVDAVVKELMSAQKLKKTNLEGKKEKLSWKHYASIAIAVAGIIVLGIYDP